MRVLRLAFHLSNSIIVSIFIGVTFQLVVRVICQAFFIGGVGAGTGALIGAIAGDAVKGLAFGAVIGGVAGGAKGIYDSEKGYEQIYRNCMIGRGYNVLN